MVHISGLLISLALSVTCVFAQVPRTVSYQGFVTDSYMKPLTGQHHLEVRLYDVTTGGAALHTEEFDADFDNGVFSVALGTNLPLSASLAFDKQYWLGISVDNGGELIPRTRMHAVPYALRSSYAESVSTTAAVTSMNTVTGAVILQGGGGTAVNQNGNIITISSTGGGGGTGVQGLQNLDGSISIANPNGPTTSVSIAAGGVTTAKIADGAVTSAKLAPGVLGSAQIADGSVGTAKLSDNAVTGAKIADGSIGTQELADGSVTNPKLAANAVSTSKIADGAVTTSQIADGSVTAAKLAPGVLNSAQVGDGSITTAKLADGAVTSAKLAAGAIGTLHIADGSVTLAKLSTAGASSGYVLTYNGSAAVWAAPPNGISSPSSSSFSTSSTIISLTNTGSGDVIDANASSGNAIDASNSSATEPTIYATNTNSSPTAPVIRAGGVDGDVMTVTRQGDLTIDGHLVVGATLGPSATPDAGGLYRDNILYGWGYISSTGSVLSSSSFGITCSRVSTGVYDITYNRSFSSSTKGVPVITVADAANVLFSGVANLTNTGCRVLIYRLDLAQQLFIGQDANFTIQITGRP